jgi:type I restriction enzyme S subunit
VLRLSTLLNSAFANYLLRCPAMVNQFVVASKGVGDIQRQIYWPYLRIVQVAIPTPEEQQAIVRFLDYANRLMGRFIRAKKQVIALLNEQKQAIIRRAVTRGIDPNVPLKPSGIHWLGDIPQHWEILRCGNVFSEVVDTGHPEAQLLSIDRFKGIIPQDETGRRTRASEDRSAYKLVKRGQLAYNVMNAFMGAIAVSGHDGIVSPAYAVAAPRRELEPLFFHHLLRTTSYTEEYNRLSYGIMYERNRLYFFRFKLVPALVPPVPEQKRIVAWIDENTAALNTAIQRTEGEIGLIREYRTRLVVDVVTGKLDVREATRNLPDETEAPPTIVAEELAEETEIVEDEQIV